MNYDEMWVAANTLYGAEQVAYRERELLITLAVVDSPQSEVESESTLTQFWHLANDVSDSVRDVLQRKP